LSSVSTTELVKIRSPLAGCLLLADRGYPSVPYFEAVEAAGGARDTAVP